MTKKSKVKLNKAELYKKWLTEPVIVVLEPKVEESLDQKLSEIFARCLQKQRHQHRFDVRKH